MNIEPATLPQIRRARDGRMVLIDADAGGIAEQMRRIDPKLKLRYSEAGEYYVVYVEEQRPDGRVDQHLVFTAQECDGRIIRRLEQIDSHGRSGYDYVRELEKAQQEQKESVMEKFRQAAREHGPELYHALRRDLGVKDRIFVPRSVGR